MELDYASRTQEDDEHQAVSSIYCCDERWNARDHQAPRNGMANKALVVCDN